jgi:hypothetical protein
MHRNVDTLEWQLDEVCVDEAFVYENPIRHNADTEIIIHCKKWMLHDPFYENIFKMQQWLPTGEVEMFNMT